MNGGDGDGVHPTVVINGGDDYGVNPTVVMLVGVTR